MAANVGGPGSGGMQMNPQMAVQGANQRSEATKLQTTDYQMTVDKKSSGAGKHQPFKSKLLPKPAHSCFGDFPQDYIKKTKKVEDFSLDTFEKSQAATASSNT